MNRHWSSTLKDAIREARERAERDHGILDAYAAARGIQTALPQENVALEDIIAALLWERGAIRVVEFAPMVGNILEVVIPVPDAESEDAVVVPA